MKWNRNFLSFTVRPAIGQCKQGRVLNNQGIGSGLLVIEHQTVALLQFTFEDESVDGNENTRPETVGVFAEPGNLRNRIAGIFPCPERRPCDIHGIGTAVNCRDADIRISCRSQKLEISHLIC